jgi:hypothetical protein
MTLFDRQPVNFSPPLSGTGGGAAERLRGELDALRNDVERLMMITEALWTMLAEQYGYTEEELVRRIHDIDLRDGRLDGKVASAGPSKCPHCGRVLEKSRPYCIYCGKPVLQDPFAR